MINNFGNQTGPSILLPDSYIDIPSLSYNIQWEAPKIAKLVQITPITMVYGTYNELVAGANLNQQTSLGGGGTLYPIIMHVYISSTDVPRSDGSHWMNSRNRYAYTL